MAVAVLTDAVDFSDAGISELSDALMQMHGLECATRATMLRALLRFSWVNFKSIIITPFLNT